MAKATFQPAFAILTARNGPDWPLPMTIASKFSLMMDSHARRTA
jgi:hypothetical protein